MSEQPGEHKYGVEGPFTYPGAYTVVYKMVTVFGPMIIMIGALSWFIFTSDSNHRADLQDAAKACQIRVAAQREVADDRLYDQRKAADGRLNTYITTSEKRFQLQRQAEVTMNNLYTAILTKIRADIHRIAVQLDIRESVPIEVQPSPTPPLIPKANHDN